MLTDGCLGLQLLLERAGLLYLAPDMPEVGVDKTVPLGSVPVRNSTGGPCSLTCLAGLATRTPGVRCLGHPQSPVAERQEPGRGSGKQDGSRNRRYQSTPGDSHQEPEPQSAEQRDKGPDQDAQDVPGALVTVLVEVQREFSTSQDTQEQARPHKGGVLAPAQGLSGEIACQAVQGHGNEGQDHLSRQPGTPPGSFGLDRLVGHLRSHGGGGSSVRGTGTADGDVGGLACAEALVLHSLVRCVDVADQDRRVNWGEEHGYLLLVTECHVCDTSSVAHYLAFAIDECHRTSPPTYARFR